MRATLLSVLAALMITTTLVSCGGKGGSTPETPLAVTTNPPDGSDQAPAPGPTFPLSVTITSTMPPGGVTIAVKAYVDGSPNAPFYTTSVSSTQSANNFTITGTPSQQTCDVSVTVTSKSQSSNTWSGTYRYAMK